MKAVSVIIPVYNAFDDAIACLKSVVEHYDSEMDLEILVLDDASSNGDFSRWFDDIGLDVSHCNISITRNQENLGFTKNVNQGFEKAGQRDVIILNSDTEVTENWIKKLQKAAYSDHSSNTIQIGTVTALTNEGNIASVPQMCQSNTIPKGYTLKTFAQLIEEVSLCEYPIIPTCVAHCVYIKREVLNTIGRFDQKNFSRGYGEENDFSCRLQKAGYCDVLDDSTFIYHKGGASFQEEQSPLMKEGSRQLLKLHPHYFDRVSKFVRTNPLHAIQSRIHMELLRRSDKDRAGRILHILHNGPFESNTQESLGGTERQVAHLIKHEENYTPWSLTTVKGYYKLQAHHHSFSKTWYIEKNPKRKAKDTFQEKSTLHQILNPKYFSLLHLHHTRWFPEDELAEALVKHGNYITSLHDYVTVCPRFHLYTVSKKHCKGTLDECHAECGFEKKTVRNYRESGLKILNNSNQIISFSDDTTLNLNTILKTSLKTEKIQHGLPNEILSTSTLRESFLKKGEPLKILLNAPNGEHKGRKIFQELFKKSLTINEQKLNETKDSGNIDTSRNIEWHVIGDLKGDNRDFYALAKRSPSVTLHGAYGYSDLKNLIADINPDLGLFLSTCPETYSLAVDEYIACGVPVIVSPLGAPKERVKKWRVGWVLESLSVKSIYTLLSEIIADQKGYEEICQNINSAPLISVAEQSQKIQNLINPLLLGNSINSFKDFESDFLNKHPLRAPKSGVFLQIASRVINIVVYLFDALGIRSYTQRLLTSLLPSRSFEKLKSLRRE